MNSQSAFHHHAAPCCVLNVLYVRSSRCIAHRIQEVPHSMVSVDRREFPGWRDAGSEGPVSAPVDRKR